MDPGRIGIGTACEDCMEVDSHIPINLSANSNNEDFSLSILAVSKVFFSLCTTLLRENRLSRQQNESIVAFTTEDALFWRVTSLFFLD